MALFFYFLFSASLLAINLSLNAFCAAIVLLLSPFQVSSAGICKALENEKLTGHGNGPQFVTA